MVNASQRSGPLTVLLTCVGRRIELTQAFRAAARRLGLPLRILAVDTDVTAPGLLCADRGAIVPPASDAGYIPALLKLVTEEQVTALIPTTDTDLPVVSAHRATFEAAGCIPLIGTPDVINVCRDKLETYRLLTAHGIDTPRTYSPEELRATRPAYPLFAKPRTGSASQRVNKIEDDLDLEYLLRRYSDLIIQEYVAGQEYTLDVYVGLAGQPRCVVPRARWQVRTGEVCKGVVVKDPEIMAAGRALVERLGPSLRGVVTLQCIVTPERRIRFIEVNPRFGGGAPLSIAAGADFAGWLLEELNGGQPTIAFDGFQHGLLMLRYDWSAFVPLPPNLAPALVPPTRPFPPFA